MVELKINPDELRPLIRSILEDAIAELAWLHSFGEKPLLSEVELADKLGIESHKLRDARLKEERNGKQICQRIGRSIFYSPQDVLRLGRADS